MATRIAQHKIDLSHPTRVRGLKLVSAAIIKLIWRVAPHAGAWIETSDAADVESARFGRTPRGCVD